MSGYLRDIEEFVASLRGGSPFLSPKEREMVKEFERRGISADALKRALSKCIKAFPPNKRSKISLLYCRGEIEREIKKRHKPSKRKERWIEVFYGKLKEAGVSIDRIPSCEEEAEKILREIERKIALDLWEKLSMEEKEEILSKYAKYKKNKEIFNSLLVRELFAKFKLPRLSLYVS